MSRSTRDPENDLKRQNGKQRGKKKKKKLSLRARIIIFIVLAVILVLLIILLMLVSKLNLINRINPDDFSFVSRSQQTFEVDSTATSDTLSPEEVIFQKNIKTMSDDDVKNILLIGQDARSGESGQRSDSMIIASVNTKTKKITLVSLMRDMYVPIPGYDDNRINAAYSFGGMKLLDQTIEKDFGVVIDGNLEVDFDGFLEAMTKVGNLDIKLTQDEADYMMEHANLGSGDDLLTEENSHWQLKAGVNSLTPAQSLAYARMRHVGNSDYERTERQRKVITAAFNKIISSDLNAMLKFADDILPCFTTDMTNSEIIGYIATVVSDNIKVAEKSYRIPVDGTYDSETIRGMSVLVPNLEQENAYLRYYLYGEEVPEDLVSSTSGKSGYDGSGQTDSSGDSSENNYSYSDGTDGSYSNGGYTDGTYSYSNGTGTYDGGYSNGGYSNGGYSDGGYSNGGYTDGSGTGGYTDGGYTDGGNGGYSDGGSTGGDTYNGSSGYDNTSGGYDGTGAQNTGYTGQADNGQNYYGGTQDAGLAG